MPLILQRNNVCELVRSIQKILCFESEKIKIIPCESTQFSMDRFDSAVVCVDRTDNMAFSKNIKNL